MFELDREKFGAFVAARRKEKGMTQRELAERLCVSDKAVSKWERSLSLPDITLLMPLAEALGVGVTELLECRRLERPAPLDAAEVETLVKKAISLSGPDREAVRTHRRRRGLILGGCALVSAAELGLLAALGSPLWESPAQLLTVPLLGLAFGVYAAFFMQERLPGYYDENSISAYSSGILRINLPGVRFHNGNWPHITRVIRVWTWAVLAGYPLACLAVQQCFPGLWEQGGDNAVLVVALGGLLFPTWLAAKRWEG